jgi:hypothetical protein
MNAAAGHSGGHAAAHFALSRAALGVHAAQDCKEIDGKTYCAVAEEKPAEKPHTPLTMDDAPFFYPAGLIVSVLVAVIVKAMCSTDGV